MNERNYYSQLSYYIKGILIIVVVGFTFYIIAALSNELAQWISFKLRKNLVFIEYILNGLFGIISILTIIYVLLTGKPRVTINDTTLRTNRFKKDFSELKSYHKGKGGSEPYVITKDGKKFDLELSWFSKKDRQEIESLIMNQLLQNKPAK